MMAAAASGGGARTKLVAKSDSEANLGTQTMHVRLLPVAGAKQTPVLGLESGDGKRAYLVIKDLHETSPGVYQTDGTVPVFGEWKALVRLHKGRSLMALPIYMPADPAIPAPAVPPWPNVTRPFQREKQILQREAVGGSQNLVRPAYGLLGALALVWVGSLGWGLRRLERAVPPDVRRGAGDVTPAPQPERQPVSAGRS
jgi:hypothetical protein